MLTYMQEQRELPKKLFWMMMMKVGKNTMPINILKRKVGVIFTGHN